MCENDDFRIVQAQIVIFEMATKETLNQEQQKRLAVAVNTIAELQPDVVPLSVIAKYNKRGT